MIQRKQSVFLFLSVICGILLMFNPVCTVVSSRGEIPVYLVKIDDPVIHSTPGHEAAVVLNFVAMILASVTIFIYRRRMLQVRLCYALALLWLVIGLMIAFCPFVSSDGSEPTEVTINYVSLVISAGGLIAAILAARNIRRDIELLKSADRIR